MTRSKPKYQRCKKCKELVLDADDCANCRERDPNRGHRLPLTGKRKAPTLDHQEGNTEEYWS